MSDIVPIMLNKRQICMIVAAATPHEKMFDGHAYYLVEKINTLLNLGDITLDSKKLAFAKSLVYLLGQED
jgi:hypothetical protein